MHRVALRPSARMAGNAANEGLPKVGIVVMDVAIPVNNVTKGKRMVMVHNNTLIIMMHASGRRCLVHCASVMVFVDTDNVRQVINNVRVSVLTQTRTDVFTSAVLGAHFLIMNGIDFLVR